MTQKTSSKTRSVPSTDGAGTILDIVDDLANTESLVATAIAAVGTEDVDPEDVQIALVIVRERLHAAMERVSALLD